MNVLGRRKKCDKKVWPKVMCDLKSSDFKRFANSNLKNIILTINTDFNSELYLFKVLVL